MLRFARNRRVFARCYSSIPFDTKPFPFSRFEPCCPDAADKPAENGFVACKEHPFPNVIGRKVDFETDMTRLQSTNRHMVVCVGQEGPEWHKAKVEKVKLGMVHAIDDVKAQQNRKEHHDKASLPPGANTLLTVCDRERIQDPKLQRPWPASDILLFPSFQVAKAVEPYKPEFREILDAIWSPNQLDVEKIKEHVAVDNLADTVQAVVLVCTHRMRDARCGVLGPILVDALKRCLHEKGLYGDEAKKSGRHVEVYGTSHFGGMV
jgi:hypothetical protein